MSYIPNDPINVSVEEGIPLYNVTIKTLALRLILLPIYVVLLTLLVIGLPFSFLWGGWCLFDRKHWSSDV